MKSAYGISLEQYTAMYEAQNGKCTICDIAGLSRVTAKSDHKRTGYIRGTLVVDHDHTSELVRDLLCIHCNQGIGSFLDKPELLRQAAVYIERQRKEEIEPPPWLEK